MAFFNFMKQNPCVVERYVKGWRPVPHSEAVGFRMSRVSKMSQVGELELNDIVKHVNSLSCVPYSEISDCVFGLVGHIEQLISDNQKITIPPPVREVDFKLKQDALINSIPKEASRKRVRCQYCGFMTVNPSTHLSNKCMKGQPKELISSASSKMTSKVCYVTLDEVHAFVDGKKSDNLAQFAIDILNHLGNIHVYQNGELIRTSDTVSCQTDPVKLGSSWPRPDVSVEEDQSIESIVDPGEGPSSMYIDSEPQPVAGPSSGLNSKPHFIAVDAGEGPSSMPDVFIHKKLYCNDCKKPKQRKQALGLNISVNVNCNMMQNDENSSKKRKRLT